MSTTAKTSHSVLNALLYITLHASNFCGTELTVCCDMQFGMSDSSSACVEIKEVDVDDLGPVMKYLYGSFNLSVRIGCISCFFSSKTFQSLAGNVVM